MTRCKWWVEYTRQGGRVIFKEGETGWVYLRQYTGTWSAFTSTQAELRNGVPSADGSLLLALFYNIDPERIHP